MEGRGGEFHRGPEEGAEVVFAGGKVGAGRAVEAHVIGQGDRLVAKAGGTVDEVLRSAGAAEEGEGRTGVEFGEHASRRSEGPKSKVARSALGRREQDLAVESRSVWSWGIGQ